MHNGFITIDKEKMSKSLGNFFTIKEILDKYDAEVVRLFILSSHYRSPIEFSNEQLRDAESSLDRYYSTIARMDDFTAGSAGAQADLKKSSSQAVDLEQLLDVFKNKFVEAMDDDFNTALAIGHIFELIRDINRFLDLKPSGETAGVLISRAKNILREICAVLNLFSRTPAQWNIDLLKIKKIPLSETDIENKIRDRKTARENKDWTRADSIRKELEANGIILEDKRDATSWKVKIT